ncbi:hypothetical protein BDV96DRAFT_583968 [Lophiotrema nucula]|uniref:DUF7730 domain-containing protein n=1 Tax=Lophiotrema nucula TaxID=690887 RepID=A0A6A5YUH5_9PLEO|nr:hypothetical protein BDV96DRAFT_583968 [Lophiotrema nucula]
MRRFNMCRCRITPERYKEKSKGRYLAQKPKALPRRRARDALSPPPREYKVIKTPRRACKKNTGQELHLPSPQSTQNESLLLGKLPAEIRLQIWAEVVGGKTIHILRKMGKVGHRICPGKGCEHCSPTHMMDNLPRMGYPPREAEPFGKEKILSETSLLPLLSTCRQIYSEAIDLLYTTNTFDFPHVWNLDFFKSTVLPKRFNTIRSITLTHRFDAKHYEDMPSDSRFLAYIPFPTPDEDWQTAAKNLNAMTSLRDLVFRITRITFRDMTTTPNGVQKPFIALSGLAKGLEMFEIVVPYSEHYYSVDLGLMQKGLDEKGVKCTVVKEARPASVSMTPLAPAAVSVPLALIPVTMHGVNG